MSQNKLALPTRISCALAVALYAIILSAGALVVSPVKVSAVTANDWQAGRIIDDGIFTDSTSMNAAEIQDFLNAKVPACDTNGDKLINGTQTRKQFSLANGKQSPPYTCLKDYYEVPKLTPGLSYTSWSSHTASNSPSITTLDKRIVYAHLSAGAKQVPVLVSYRNTVSGMVEFDVWNSDMKSWQSHTVSNQPSIDPANSQIEFADIMGAGTDAPILVGLQKTGSGMVEFHVWNSDMKSWQSHTVSNQPSIDPANSQIEFADQTNQKRDYPVLIGLSNTGSGNVEFHTWNSGFNSWFSHVSSNQSTVDPTKNSIQFADVNGDGKQEPVLIGLTGTASGTVEFHVWNSNESNWLWNLSSNQSTVDPTKNSIQFADVNGDGKQEPVLIGLTGTASGTVEFHVWAPSIPANNYGGKPIPAGAVSAAQLIWNAAQKYRISPKVLLTTIQKESAGPLTTDDWPYESQYTYAMGAHCPDSGPGNSANCDPDYAGFSIQISESASLMRYYLDNMSQSWWPYKTQGSNTIQFNPNTACGSTSVNILTKSTAALYTYTPYQPNQPALDNMNGQGDNCSAYGNRNFWRIYNEWFGSSVGKCLSDEQASLSVGRLYNPTTYQHFWTSYVCEANSLQKMGFSYEGNAFYQTTAVSPNAVTVHRLYNPSTQQHLWVTTQDEINAATQRAGYQYEGVAFYAAPPPK